MDISSVTNHICSKCGKKYEGVRKNFYVSHARIYGGTGFLNVCITCVNDMYRQYYLETGSEKKALRRLCRNLNVYWNEKAYEYAHSKAVAGAIVGPYFNKLNHVQYAGKDYDTTLEEESVLYAYIDDSGLKDSSIEEVSEDIKLYWGRGFTDNTYKELEEKKQIFIEKLNKQGRPLDVGGEEILKKVCILDIEINKATMSGKSIDKYLNTYNSLLGSLNLKPNQNTDDDSIDNTPFGQWIRMCEDDRPIPKPSKEFDDVDNIIKYFSTWVLGHLCKMFNLKNGYLDMYEKAIKKLRIDHPEFDEEDDDEDFLTSILSINEDENIEDIEESIKENEEN